MRILCVTKMTKGLWNVDVRVYVWLADIQKQKVCAGGQCHRWNDFTAHLQQSGFIQKLAHLAVDILSTLNGRSFRA